MAITNYKRGANFEYRVREIFRKHGFIAERKAASAPYDIIVMKAGRVFFVADAKKTSQDKNHIYVDRADIDKIIAEAARLCAKPLIVYGFQRTPVYVKPAEDMDSNRLEAGVELEEFLEKLTDTRLP